MRPPDLLVSETREWRKRARADAQAAELLAGAGLYSESVYHCQQCAEKALKAILTWNQQPFPKTHDLGDLRVLCEQVSPLWKDKLQGVERLTQYAWRFRYPGAPWEPTDADAATAIAAVKGVLSVVEDYLRPVLDE